MKKERQSERKKQDIRTQRQINMKKERQTERKKQDIGT